MREVPHVLRSTPGTLASVRRLGSFLNSVSWISLVSFQSLLDDDRMEDIRRMYLLYGRVKAQDQLQQAWLLYCR